MKKNDKTDVFDNLEDIALAYTAKSSTAETPEQFLDDYVNNIKLFEELKKKNSGNWLL